MSETLLIALQAVVQGITEFLPISSSAHLILVWNFFDNVFTPEQRLALDVALHVGTLLAVVAFFWKDVARLIKGGIDLLCFKATPERSEAIKILVATIPLILVGFLAKDLMVEVARAPIVIAFSTIFFGILLWAGDYYGLQNPKSNTENDVQPISLLDAAFIGFMQIFALIPGTSRSGVTMTAARFRGISRVDAARFALLLSIPAILGAGTLSGIDLMKAGNLQVGYFALLSAGLAALVAYVAIWAMVTWLKTASFLPFVIYRLVLGCLLLYFLV
ncbi:MAG: undecaprenyl-diphosphate phosphatase [Alphaproteobacteria bacterium]